MSPAPGAASLWYKDRGSAGALPAFHPFIPGYFGVGSVLRAPADTAGLGCRRPGQELVYPSGALLIFGLTPLTSFWVVLALISSELGSNLGPQHPGKRFAELL